MVHWSAFNIIEHVPWLSLFYERFSRPFEASCWIHGEHCRRWMINRLKTVQLGLIGFLFWTRKSKIIRSCQGLFQVTYTFNFRLFGCGRSRINDDKGMKILRFVRTLSFMRFFFCRWLKELFSGVSRSFVRAFPKERDYKASIRMCLRLQTLYLPDIIDVIGWATNTDVDFVIEKTQSQ